MNMIGRHNKDAERLTNLMKSKETLNKVYESLIHQMLIAGETDPYMPALSHHVKCMFALDYEVMKLHKELTDSSIDIKKYHASIYGDNTIGAL